MLFWRHSQCISTSFSCGGRSSSVVKMLDWERSKLKSRHCQSAAAGALSHNPRLYKCLEENVNVASGVPGTLTLIWIKTVLKMNKLLRSRYCHSEHSVYLSDH